MQCWEIYSPAQKTLKTPKSETFLFTWNLKMNFGEEFFKVVKIFLYCGQQMSTFRKYGYIYWLVENWMLKRMLKTFFLISF